MAAPTALTQHDPSAGWANRAIVESLSRVEELTLVEEVTIDGSTIRTARVRLRPWREDDAPAALEIYGSAEVAHWLAPAMEQVTDVDTMRATINSWLAMPPGPDGRVSGRWVIEEIESGRVAGSAQILPLPPEDEDLEVGYQLAPWAWGRGLGSEAGHALAHYAFANGEEEIFAVVRPRNEHGIRAARRIGMEWVGETEKYYDLRLQVYRLRNSDLDVSLLHPSPVER